MLDEFGAVSVSVLVCGGAIMKVDGRWVVVWWGGITRGLHAVWLHTLVWVRLLNVVQRTDRQTDYRHCAFGVIHITARN